MKTSVQVSCRSHQQQTSAESLLTPPDLVSVIFEMKQRNLLQRGRLSIFLLIFQITNFLRQLKKAKNLMQRWKKGKVFKNILKACSLQMINKLNNDQ